MADTFTLEIATPERLLLREEASEAQIPTPTGFIGVLPLHAPLLSSLGTGVLTYTVGGQPHRMAVSGGHVEVLPDHVRVLARRAEKAAEIDIDRAERAFKRAQERLGQAGADSTSMGIDLARAMDAMYRAQARLEAAKS